MTVSKADEIRSARQKPQVVKKLRQAVTNLAKYGVSREEILAEVQEALAEAGM